MQARVYTVAQAAAAVGCNPRTIRRHLAAGALPGAHQQHTAQGKAWRIPGEALDKLRVHLALDVSPGAVEVEPPAAAPPLEHQAHGHQLAPVQLDQAGQLGQALVALATQQAAAIAAQVQQLEHAREDALWWRCEALDARQQLDQVQGVLEHVRAQLAAVQVEAAQLRAQLEPQAAPSVRVTRPISRAQLRALDGGV
jgi:hypothetical protein